MQNSHFCYLVLALVIPSLNSFTKFRYHGQHYQVLQTALEPDQTKAVLSHPHRADTASGVKLKALLFGYSM